MPQYHAPSSPECKLLHQAMRDTLDVVSGKWKLVILGQLLERPYRFKELSRELGISARVLTRELQEMEANKLVTRTVLDTRPVAVEYAATPYSATLRPVVEAIRNWGVLHHRALDGEEANHAQ